MTCFREPLSRSISAYYYYGELATNPKKNKKASSARGVRSAKNRTIFVQGTYSYNGDEESVPSLAYAMQYASNLNRFYKVGSPGPAFTWSLLSGSFDESTKHMRSGAVVPLLLERLDESLIALRHEMGWSIADIVILLPRKALSKHPRASDWPREAVEVLNSSLHRMKEFDFYETTRSALQKRVDHLSLSGVDFALELEVLRALRSRVTEVRTYCVQMLSLCS
jgi:hypothetical protein